MLSNESENKMKAINFVLSILRINLPYYRSFVIPMKWTFKDKPRLYRTSYISKYLLRSLGLRYIRVLLYIYIYIYIYIYYDNWKSCVERYVCCIHIWTVNTSKMCCSHLLWCSLLSHINIVVPVILVCVCSIFIRIECFKCVYLPKSWRLSAMVTK